MWRKKKVKWICRHKVAKSRVWKFEPEMKQSRTCRKKSKGTKNVWINGRR